MSQVWAGIVRVSHIGTRGGDSFHADEDQVADVERYALSHGARVEFMAPELSVSGGKPIEQRPSLKAAIEGVERGEYSGIVVAYLSRLTRSRSGIEIWDRVEAAGGHVHCAAENLDTSTANGRFIRDIHLANAVREREEHAERHAKRREQTVAAGVWRPRQLPRGMEFVGPPNDDGRYRGLARRLQPIAGPEGDEVRAAFRDKAAGVTYSELARRLAMTPGGVRAMLRNRVYLGELHDSGHVNPTAHEPLIDQDTFDAAQRDTPRPARSKTRPPALLAGLVRCAGCGHVMSRGSGNGRDYYSCAGSHSGQQCEQRASIICDVLHEHVTPLVLHELENIRSRAGHGDALQAARAERAAAERELATYLAAVSAADVGAEAFAAGAAPRRQRVVDAIANEQRLLAAQPAVIPLGGTAARLWDDLETHERNVLLRALLDVVAVRRAGGRGAAVPVEDRVRVVRAGSGLQLPHRTRGRAMGLHPINFDDLTPPAVLGILRGEDLLERRRSASKM